MLLIEEQTPAANGGMGARAWLAAVLIGLWQYKRPPLDISICSERSGLFLRWLPNCWSLTSYTGFSVSSICFVVDGIFQKLIELLPCAWFPSVRKHCLVTLILSSPWLLFTTF